MNSQTMMRNAPLQLQTSPKPPKPLFLAGKIVVTPAAQKLLQRHGFTVEALIERHVRGDYGDAGRQDAIANDEAVKSGARITSVYRLVEEFWLQFVSEGRETLPTVWVITDAAAESGKRKRTTILRPEEL